MAGARVGGAPGSRPDDPPPVTSPRSAGEPRILSVSELNRAVAASLERGFPLLWVAGEISNFTRAASGHWYFTLKDAGAQVRAVMFRGRAQYVDFAPREGDRVEVRALPGLYEPRGEFQLGVEQMRRAGAGDLFQRFLQLKERLQREGLFEDARKRALPSHPRAIGVVTSAQAAALRDVLTTLRRRAPHLPVIVYPTTVQGADAPPSIVAALRVAAARAEVDVLLLVRGGGSIEDLWSFNDERVARAVAASPVPVVCGVGHETDFTIADFVADVRAPTPTAAAAAASPDRRQMLERVHAQARTLSHCWLRRAQRREQRLDTAARLLRPPSHQWHQRGLRLAALADRLASAWGARQVHARHRLAHAQAGLRAPRLVPLAERVGAGGARLARASSRVVERRDARVEQAAIRLELASPVRRLERGYAIVRDERGALVRSAHAVASGAPLEVLLADGTLDVRAVGARADDGAATPASQTP